MYRVITSLLLLVLTPIFTFAQAPEGINYQAVARDGNGDILLNQSLTIRLTIKESGPAGTTVYQETHNASTNDFGLFSLTIGQGSTISGSFSNLDWGSNSHFLQVEVDDGGGYTNMGTTQFVSVPYALYAKEAGGGGGSYQAGTGIDITGSTISNTAPDQTITISGSGGTSVSGSYPNFTIASDPSLWSDNTAGIHYTGGQVGIGSNLPLQPLHVDGAVLFGSDTSGAGVRLRWIPDKNAFRSGEVKNTASGVWDWDSIGHASFAHGDNVLASGSSSASFGSNIRTSGLASLGAGYGVEVYGDFSYGRGATILADGEGAQASGFSSRAVGDYTLALGTYDTANQQAAIAIGFATAADGQDAIAIGTQTRAIGSSALAIGDGAKSLVGTSTAIGYAARATDFATLSVGRGTQANGEGSLAIGLGARTEGNYSYSIGWNTYTASENGLALGTYDTAGEQSTAIGFYSSATGKGGIGMGRVSRATGNDAIAIGYNNRATGTRAIALGAGNESTAINSLGFGIDNTTSGMQALAMGSNSEALGTFSIAIGDGALAKAEKTIALGYWNVGVGAVNASTSTTSLLEIGNGVNAGTRSNAFTILKNGHTGIGLSDPQHRLTVPVTTQTVPDGDGIGILNTSTSNYWNLHMTNTYLRFSYNNSTVAYIHSNGTYVQPSDARLKTAVTPSEPVLDRVNRLNVVQYAYQHDENREMTVGLLAQETEPLFPELVIEDEASDYLGINYSGLSVVAVKAIQEQQAMINEQQVHIESLEKQNAALEKQYKALEQRLTDLEAQ